MLVTVVVLLLLLRIGRRLLWLLLHDDLLPLSLSNSAFRNLQQEHINKEQKIIKFLYEKNLNVSFSGLLLLE